MRKTDVIIIGAGQAGLAMSRVLSQRGIDHRVLERGRVAERWRSERWESLRLLTPNWCTHLPGWQCRGAEPDGFMDMGQVVRFFEDYAASFAAPVLTGGDGDGREFRQRTRKSSFIDGVGDDALAVAGHLAAHLGADCRMAI